MDVCKNTLARKDSRTSSQFQKSLAVSKGQGWGSADVVPTIAMVQGMIPNGDFSDPEWLVTLNSGHTICIIYVYIPVYIYRERPSSKLQTIMFDHHKLG